jgi:hypothetical protein
LRTGRFWCGALNPAARASQSGLRPARCEVDPNPHGIGAFRGYRLVSVCRRGRAEAPFRRPVSKSHVPVSRFGDLIFAGGMPRTTDSSSPGARRCVIWTATTSPACGPLASAAGVSLALPIVGAFACTSDMKTARDRGLGSLAFVLEKRNHFARKPQRRDLVAIACSTQFVTCMVSTCFAASASRFNAQSRSALCCTAGSPPR